MIKDLKSGTIVQALVDLDPRGANITTGAIGVVFGAANCYGDECGPIVRWFRAVGKNVIVRGTCNVYEGDVRVVTLPEDDYLKNNPPCRPHLAAANDQTPCPDT